METWQGREVSAEVMAKLARLMATENISIEHHNVNTAAFDVRNRVLYLPNWGNITRAIYQLFVVHEVGHALHTPADGVEPVFERGAGFRSLVNVLEDCRIEKKQKRRFPGAAPEMEEGYRELLKMNFFGTVNRELSSYGFIDRVNLKSKCGDDLDVEFDADEAVLYKRAMETETFEEMLALAEEIWDKKDELDQGEEPEPEQDESNDDDDDETVDSAPESDDTQKAEQPPADADESDDEEDDSDHDSPPSGAENDPSDDEEESDGANPEPKEDDDSDNTSETTGAGDEDADEDDDEIEQDNETSQNDSNDDGDDEGEEEDSDATGKGGAAGGESAVSGGKDWSERDVTSETDAASQEAAKDLVDSTVTSPSYVQVGADDTFNLSNIVIPNKEIQSQMATEFNESYGNTAAQYREAALQDLKEFKAKNKKAINFLVKEFEMRKAANASQRAAVASTGVLDANKLHSFKWNDDVFKKITNVADGKSHGLVLFVDWSGSMQENMRGTMEQVLILVLFCQRVNIPFQVFGFSDAWGGQRYFQRANPDTHGLRQRNLKRGDLEFYDCNLNLLEIATSDTKGKGEAINMMVALTQIRGHFSHGRHRASAGPIHAFPIPRALHLGGTPLSETIITAIPIVNNFRKAHNLEIVNIVFLTDGEGCDLRSAKDVDYNYGGTYVKHARKQTKIGELRDGKNTAPQMNILLDVLRERTDSHVVNFYIANPAPRAFKQDVMSSLRGRHSQTKELAKDALKTAKVEGGVTIDDPAQGWDAQYIILGGKHLNTVASKGMVVEKKKAVATKNELKKAFTGAAQAKLKCRVILQKFVGMIAQNS